MGTPWLPCQQGPTETLLGHHTPAKPVPPLPTPAANKERAKSTHSQGSTRLIPAAGFSTSRSWKGPRHTVLGSLHPSRGRVTAPSTPNFSLSFSGSISFPPALCHQPRGNDRSANSCVESFPSSGQSAEGTDPAWSITATLLSALPSLIPGPVPQGAPSVRCSTKTAQNCSHHSHKRALTYPPTLPQDQANWQHTSITESSSCGCLPIPNEWVQRTPGQEGEHPELCLW